MCVCVWIDNKEERSEGLSKFGTVVEGEPKDPFSIDTTMKCRKGRHSFPWIAPLYLDPYLIMLNVNQSSIKYHFLSLWYDSTWD